MSAAGDFQYAVADVIHGIERGIPQEDVYRRLWEALQVAAYGLYCQDDPDIQELFARAGFPLGH